MMKGSPFTGRPQDYTDKKRSSGEFSTNSPNTSTIMNAGKMPEIPNVTGNALHFAKCKMSWQKLIK